MVGYAPVFNFLRVNVIHVHHLFDLVACPCGYGQCHKVTEDDITDSGIVINGTFINNSSFNLNDERFVLACECTRGYEGLYCNKSMA